MNSSRVKNWCISSKLTIKNIYMGNRCSMLFNHMIYCNNHAAILTFLDCFGTSCCSLHGFSVSSNSIVTGSSRQPNIVLPKLHFLASSIDGTTCLTSVSVAVLNTFGSVAGDQKTETCRRNLFWYRIAPKCSRYYDQKRERYLPVTRSGWLSGTKQCRKRTTSCAALTEFAPNIFWQGTRDAYQLH